MKMKKKKSSISVSVHLLHLLKLFVSADFETLSIPGEFIEARKTKIVLFDLLPNHTGMEWSFIPSIFNFPSAASITWSGVKPQRSHEAIKHLSPTAISLIYLQHYSLFPICKWWDWKVSFHQWIRWLGIGFFPFHMIGNGILFSFPWSLWSRMIMIILYGWS